MTPHRRRGAPPIDWAVVFPLLGTMSDGELARRVDCTAQTITAKRIEMGVPPHGMSDDLLADLGTDTDANVARKHGVHHAYVNRLRRQHEIPRYEAPHGTSGRYRTCKCPVCRRAQADRMIAYRRAKPEVVRAIDKKRRARKLEARANWMFDPNL